MFQNFILKRNIAKAEHKVIYGEIETKRFKNVIGHFFENEGRPMINMSCTKSKGNKTTLFELIEKKEEKILFFAFNSNDCMDCVNHTLEKLAPFQTKREIIIVSDFKNLAAMKIYSDKFQLDSATFARVDNISKFSTPAVFQIDRDKRISKFLMIEQDDVILEQYLNYFVLKSYE
jgi:hypothetical protein